MERLMQVFTSGRQPAKNSLNPKQIFKEEKQGLKSKTLLTLMPNSGVSIYFFG
ncbi:MAG TPA: hypothetical protein VN963_02705 [bacterium]|nr:hypothetical protein [bacterium]